MKLLDRADAELEQAEIEQEARAKTETCLGLCLSLLPLFPPVEF